MCKVLWTKWQLLPHKQSVEDEVTSSIPFGCIYLSTKKKQSISMFVIYMTMVLCADSNEFYVGFFLSCWIWKEAWTQFIREVSGLNFKEFCLWRQWLNMKQ